ncbi:MAG: hypothetical protein M3R00_02370 [Pseudomonadota bacterium]|nr:hypothetical protein [Pseudomonadota bacterium]
MQEIHKNVLLKIALDSGLSNQDQWALAYSCTRFYNTLRNHVVKSDVYKFGVIPDGLLSATIFEKYLLDNKWLHDFFKAGKHINHKLYLDNKLVWPLVALLGMEDEDEENEEGFGVLEELVKDDPLQKDATGRRVIDYLAIGNHLEFMHFWIQKYYRKFSQEDAPELLDIALESGNEELARILIEGYKFSLWSTGVPSATDPILDRIVKSGIQYFVDKAVEDLEKAGLGADAYFFSPILAASAKRWRLFDYLLIRYEYKDAPANVELETWINNEPDAETKAALINMLESRQNNEFSDEEKAELVCYAARDDKDRFFQLIDKCKDFNFSEFEIDDLNLYHFACMGGDTKVVDYINEHNLVPTSNRQGSADGCLIAAAYGNKELIHHLFKIRWLEDCDTATPDICLEEWLRAVALAHVKHQKMGMLNFAAGHGDWHKFLLLVKSYFIDPDSPQYLLSLLSKNFPIKDAVENGHLYFVQKFVQKYGDADFKDSRGEALLALAKDSDNPFMLRWVTEQVELVKRQEEASKLGCKGGNSI